MEAPKYYSLRKAARVFGVDRGTLKAWLSTDLGLEFPVVARGSKFLVPEADFLAVLRLRAPHRNLGQSRAVPQVDARKADL